MQKTLCTTLVLGVVMLVAAEPALAQSSEKTVTLNNVTANNCAYNSISVASDGNITVDCKSAGATAPGKPGGATATPYDAKISVSYTAAASNGSAVTQYTAICESVDAGAATPVSASGAGAVTSLLVTGATNGKSYTCRVQARNSVGDGEFSDPTAAVTPQLGLDPSAPAKMAKPTVAAASGSITVSFSAPANGGSAITGYGATCESSDAGVAGSASGGAAAASIAVSGLSGGKTYTCKVRASNAMGPGEYSDPSDPVTLPAGCGALPDGTTVGSWAAYSAPGIPLETGTINATKSKAFSFVANQSIYTNGSQILFETTTQPGGSNRVDVAISTCPGEFTSSQPRCVLTNAKINTLNTTFNPAETTACVMNNGQQYYLNVRPSAGYANAAKIVSPQMR